MSRPGVGRGGGPPVVRALAWGGVVGPVAFVADWALLGTTDGYAPLQEAISRLAAVGAPTASAMTVGLAAYGAGLVAFGVALRQGVPGRAWVASVVTGAATVAVAALPLGGPAGDTAHAAAAAVGYVGLASMPVLSAPTWLGPAVVGSRRGSRAVGAVAAALLATSIAVSPGHGLTQRLGLTVGDLWVVLAARRLLSLSRA